MTWYIAAYEATKAELARAKSQLQAEIKELDAKLKALESAKAIMEEFATVDDHTYVSFRCAISPISAKIEALEDDIAHLDSLLKDAYQTKLRYEKQAAREAATEQYFLVADHDGGIYCPESGKVLRKVWVEAFTKLEKAHGLLGEKFTKYLQTW
jgi:hypothetical protein